MAFMEIRTLGDAERVTSILFYFSRVNGINYVVLNYFSEFYKNGHCYVS
jgi:hypothetical protein